ncbi:hypothetical protein OH77DRAFT_20932 [Trametes cingulata]|nr:hypothetical protein OH77DRAFT_20932 [Trametes cingulata]
MVGVVVAVVEQLGEDDRRAGGERPPDRDMAPNSDPAARCICHSQLCYPRKPWTQRITSTGISISAECGTTMSTVESTNQSSSVCRIRYAGQAYTTVRSLDNGRHAVMRSQFAESSSGRTNGTLNSLWTTQISPSTSYIDSQQCSVHPVILVVWVLTAAGIPLDPPMYVQQYLAPTQICL